MDGAAKISAAPSNIGSEIGSQLWRGGAVVA
ncbi:hypothetical protein RSal33209_0041 [Renibacterium salmoninarum ATCC 33209]|uniref:Uncharacterized protein n=1 Tax=Renibacterium salmoninarum (strain ATCC 33209 / DSM 20767 / JCM 11484 / NBRC 15589 / NCIMB 2235) TaxID=288705 RepID=A9WL84_RENSM|nr:hypothetical protein RSal33209_0041 [Renibacterium salmoninarum ATCC 33209]